MSEPQSGMAERAIIAGVKTVLVLIALVVVAAAYVVHRTWRIIFPEGVLRVR